LDIEDLQIILSKGENKYTEFKSAYNKIPLSFYETVSSFSNTDGGTIFLGINDDCNIEGVQPELIRKFKNDIISNLNSPDCINPSVYVEPYIINHPNGNIMVIQIPASSQVHKYANRIFIRQFESDIDITDDQNKVTELYINKSNYFTESNIYPSLSINDFDNKLFEKARDIIRGNKSDHPWLRIKNEEMLKESTLWRKDFKNGQEGFTLAAVLIFGKDLTIQSILPAYKIEAMVRINNIDRWDDRINPPLRTNLIDTYIILKEFISKHLPDKFYLEGDKRIDLRDKIFREVIGNIIVHREYTSSLSTEIIIYKNKVLLTNPNKAHFHGPIDLNNFNPYPKNPNIRKFFSAFGWTDEIGSGIRNTTKYLPLYAKDTIPVFIEEDIFKTEIPLETNSFIEFKGKIFQWLEIDENFSQHLEKGLNKININLDLINLSWDNIISKLVSTWLEKSTNHRELNLLKEQYINNEHKKNVPSMYQKSIKLLPKKLYYLIEILFLCAEPISLGKMMICLNYKNKKTFRENYLYPLEKIQFVEKTDPEKLNNPEQKYRLTEKGKLFLGGNDY
jgi:ATP-dependent DNA helicase RecG